MVPVFIGGCPRSGTTMLGSLLGANSKCIATPESQFKNELINNLSLLSDERKWIDFLENHWRFKIWSLDIEPLRSRYFKNFQEFLNAVVHLYALKEQKAEATYWIDHTPTNFRYVSRLKDLYPDARFIHIVRDGRAVAASVLPLDWGPNNIITAGKWWMEHVVFGLAAEKYSEQVLMVQYENIIESPEEALKRICSFIGIPYEANMIQGKGFNVPEYTRSQHQLVGAGVVKDRKEVWKKKLSARQVELFEDTTKGLLEYFGYELLYKEGARQADGFEKLQCYFSLARNFVNSKFLYPSRRRRAV